MSILRKNLFTREWVLYAKNRDNRPYEFKQNMSTISKGGVDCPFCKESGKIEHDIIYKDKENWSLCAIPNLYPIINDENFYDDTIEREDFYQTTEGLGRHEVIVDTCDHNKTIDQFSKHEFLELFKALDNRYMSMIYRNNCKYIQIFKNNGPSAGMSIRHSHWQILSLPIVPDKLIQMSSSMDKDSCKFCDMLEYELNRGSRVILENEHFVAIAPYASRVPYEVWISPKRHFAHFIQRTPEENDALIDILSKYLKKLVKVQEGIGYNICFYGGILNGDHIDCDLDENSVENLEKILSNQNYHWHLVVVPRVGGFAGFELATDCYINSILPEDAKKKYDSL